LRAREERLRFFDRLSEDLRVLTRPEEVMAQTARSLGQHLRASVVACADMGVDQDQMNIRGDWAADGSRSIVGTYSLGAFGKTVNAALRAGRPFITFDTLAELGPDEGRALLDLGLGATVCMPYLKDGQLTALMAVHQKTPREWTNEELSLIAEATDRSWAHVERVRAEAVLCESERLASETHRRLDAILNNTTMAVFLMDDRQHCVFANAAAERLTGFSFAELSAKPLHDVIHHRYPDGRPYPLHECPIDRALPERANMQGEELFVHKDGQFYPVAFTASPLLDESGAAVGTVIEVRSIAEERAREAALRESEERFRNMADNTPVMMWVTDPTGHCTYLNERWYEFTGQAPHEGEGLGWVQAVHPEDRPLAEQAFLAANAKQVDYRVEFRLRRADGAYRWALDAAAARVDADGTFMGYVGSVIDIDERREAEQAVQDSEQRLRLATAAADIGTWDFDPVSGVLRWDERCRQLFGVPADAEVSYDVFLTGLHPEDRERADDAVQAALSPEGNGSYSVTYRTVGLEDGRVRWIAANGGAVFDQSDGSPRAVRFIGTVIDITERMKAEQHQRLLIDELSHRAKNLLAIIQSVAQQSFKGTSEPAEMLRAFEGRLGALAAAHGILTREKWEAAPIRRIICDTITAVKNDDHRLKLDGPDLLLPPKTSVSLAMAIHELATNAVKYGSFSGEDGTVAIRWRAEDGRLKLEWRESGGPPVTAPAKRGFGSRMIERGLAAELGGKVRIDFEPEGVVCTVDAPMPEAG
jgi:PAS domain S-box-containing protein